MADKNDPQHPRPLVDPASLPVKKRATLFEPTSVKEPASLPLNDDEEDDAIVNSFEQESKKRILEELKKKAFCSVLYALSSETFELSDRKSEIIPKLMQEWNIPQSVYDYVWDKILIYLTNPQVNSNEVETVANRLLNISMGKAVASSTSNVPESRPWLGRVDPTAPVGKSEASSSGASAVPEPWWGKQDPFSLIGKVVYVRLPDEDDFDEFLIEEFDPELESHRLEFTDLKKAWSDEFDSWIDLRELVPDTEIKWKDGEDPDV